MVGAGAQAPSKALGSGAGAAEDAAEIRQVPEGKKAQ